MRMFTRAIFVLGIALSGCGRTGVPAHDVESKDNFEVEKLFVVDGCTVYRFRDWGSAHYFTNCTQPMSQVSCGKNCRREESIGGLPTTEPTP